MARGRPKLGADEAAAAAERRRAQSAERMRRMRERRRAGSPVAQPEPPPAEAPQPPSDRGGICGVYLRLYVERIELLELEARQPGMHPDDRRSIQSEIKEVYAEAKARGFTVDLLKEAIRVRRLDREHIGMLTLYLEALPPSTG